MRNELFNNCNLGDKIFQNRVLWRGGGKRVKLGISGLLHSRGHVGCPLWLGDAAAQTSLDL